jgi:hypothetical protein
VVSSTGMLPNCIRHGNNAWYRTTVFLIKSPYCHLYYPLMNKASPSPMSRVPLAYAPLHLPPLPRPSQLPDWPWGSCKVPLPPQPHPDDKHCKCIIYQWILNGTFFLWATPIYFCLAPNITIIPGTLSTQCWLLLLFQVSSSHWQNKLFLCAFIPCSDCRCEH